MTPHPSPAASIPSLHRACKPAPRLTTERLLIAALWVLFGFVVIKAASTDLIFDEAWSFFTYAGSPLGFLRLDIANNHPLNSLLVYLATRLFGSAELVIRLPDILAGALYLAATGALIRRVRLKLVGFAICALQPFFLDYFSLARGYGLAIALVQFGLVQHFFVGRGRERYPVLLGAVLAASLALFSTVLALYALIAAHVLVEGAEQRGAGASLLLRRERMSLLFLLAGAAPLGALLWVSRSGLPLVASGSGFFGSTAVTVAQMFVPDPAGFAVAVAALAGLAACLLLWRTSLSRRTVILLLTVALLLIAVWLGARLGKPLPARRVLLPWLPIWNLLIVSLAEDIFGALPGSVRHRLWMPSAALLAGLVWAFCLRLHFTTTNDWWFYAGVQPRLVQALVLRHCLPSDLAADYAQVYYMKRWFPSGRFPPEPTCPAQPGSHGGAFSGTQDSVP